MANRRKTINPIIQDRLNECLKECGKSNRWICRNILKDGGIEYSSSNFSKFTTGKSQPPDWIMQKLSSFFSVRLEWLYGLDNFKTDADIVTAHQNMTNEEMASIINQSLEIVATFNRNVKYGHILQLLKSTSFSKFDLSQIQNLDHFLEFLDVEFKHSIELYLQQINTNIKRKDDE